MALHLCRIVENLFLQYDMNMEALKLASGFADCCDKCCNRQTDRFGVKPCQTYWCFVEFSRARLVKTTRLETPNHLEPHLLPSVVLAEALPALYILHCDPIHPQSRQIKRSQVLAAFLQAKLTSEDVVQGGLEFQVLWFYVATP